MKQLLVFIRKEFYHVFRDRRTLLIMFVLPVIQILLFGFALTNEVKNVNMVISDHANDVHSRQLVARIKASDYFTVEETALSDREIETAFRKGTIKGALIFPPQFGNDLRHGNKAQVRIIADASDPNVAKTIVNYLSAIIRDYQQQQLNPASETPYRIVPELRMLYNEEGNGSLNFVPGVIALIFMIVCTTLTSVSVVREKEFGTMEVLLVSPMKPIMVLVSKAIPYLLLSILNFLLIIGVAVLVLEVPIRGNFLLLFLESTLFIITCLSLGLLISNRTSSQETAMLASMMGMMVPTIIFTGFLFPIENMPMPLQIVSNIIPSRWYFIIVKAIMLKGLGISYIWKETLILAFMTTVLLTVALKNFKIRLA